MKAFRADFLYCSANQVIENGVIIIDDLGKIIAILSKNEENRYVSEDEIITLKGILAPGFINTHCHLELSVFHNSISQGCTIDGFIRGLETAKKTIEIDKSAIRNADHDLWEEGIVAVADISNTTDTIEVKSQSKIVYHTFVEVFGSNSEFADKIYDKAQKIKDNYLERGLTASITPHSLYACSEPLMGRMQEENGHPLSIHFMESEEENDFFEHRTGSMIARSKFFGVNPTQHNTYRKRASEIATIALASDRKLLFVHNTVATEEDVKALIDYFKDPWFCLCPNSNIYIENKLPDINMIAKQTQNITIGTDSLASNTRLSVLEELKTIALHFPEISTSTLLKWGTENGAKFMGIDERFGTLKVGANPGLNQLVCDTFELKNVTKVIKIS